MSVTATIAITKVTAEVSNAGYTAHIASAPVVAEIGGAVTYTANDTVTRANAAGVTVYAGMAVALHTDGTSFVKADASSATKPAFAVAGATIANGFSGVLHVDNYVTVGDWTDATGRAALTTNAIYYVSATTAGMLTTTAPTSGYVQAVGRAISTTTLELSIERPIKRA